MNGLITHIQRFSVHDGPGIRTTVFFKGCPLACPWCQNPETISNRPEVIFHSENCIACKTCVDNCPKKCFAWKGKITFVSNTCNLCGICVKRCPTGTLRWSAETMPSENVLQEVLEDKVYYDISGGGITISGGEPLMQIDFLVDLLQKTRRKGIHTALDTSGYAPSEFFERILPMVDLFLFDIKFIDPKLHEKYTGVSNTLILENFRRLIEAEKCIIIRIPLIPGISDTDRNISDIASFLKMNTSYSIPMVNIPFNKLMEKKYTMLGKMCPLFKGKG